MTETSVIFIEPAEKKTNVFENYMRLPLMGSLYLGTILHNHGYQVQILNENILSKEIDPFEIHADIFCITSLTVSANRAKLLANQIKKIYPASMVIVGGIHASLMTEEFTDIADHVVIGEAEEIIIDVVEGKFTEKIIHGSKIQNLDDLPIVNYSLLHGYETINVIPLMTSRGCPFNCNFCSVTKMFGRKFRMQSPLRIIAEIENVLTYFKNKGFFFYDDNFTADKKRVSEFCDLITDKKIDIAWTAQVRSDLAQDPELVSKMADAGLQCLCIGFESIDDETLKALHKSQTKTDIERAIDTFHEFGIDIHGMFIFGEDHDTVKNISRTVDFAIENKVDTVQFMILTPFPGTECYETLLQENRLFHKNWDYYNAMFVVFQPKNMSPVRLINETYRAYQKFYSLKRTLLDMFSLMFNIFLDALVWNFKRVNQYSLDAMFLRGGAKIIIKRHSAIYTTYLKYLVDLEKRNILK